MRITAIIVALNEQEFIKPCLTAIYPFVDRINIQTNYDRSWSGLSFNPDTTVPQILEFPDPVGKLSLHIARIPDEALARNWLMRSDGYALDHRHRSSTSSREAIADFCDRPDYFWIIDTDEIYDPETIPQILDYLRVKHPRVLKIRGITYFKSWNYQITPSDGFFQPGFIRPGVLFHDNRNLVTPRWFRLLMNKYWWIDVQNTQGIVYLPEEIAVFHHGAYVGSDERIYKKVHASVHYDALFADWYERVWRNWTPSMREFHPFVPKVFQSVEYVPTNKLPAVIANTAWRSGYIDLEEPTKAHPEASLTNDRAI